jgi:hypothetical protein
VPSTLTREGCSWKMGRGGGGAGKGCRAVATAQGIPTGNVGIETVVVGK